MATYRPRKAERVQLKARIAITGVDHAGKSLTSLMFAYGLGGRVCVIDTDYGSSEKYLGLPGVSEFDIIIVTEFTPEEHVAAIDAAKGYDVLVIDTVSQEWIESLAIKDALTAASESKNSFTEGWLKVTPRHNKFMAALRAYDGHLIVTVREHIKYEMVPDGKGGVKPEKLGLGPIQRQDFGHSWDLLCAMDAHNNMTVDARKGVGLDLQGKTFRRPGPEFMEPVKRWLGSGVPVYSRQEILDAAIAAGYSATDVKAQMANIAPGVGSYDGLTVREKADLYFCFAKPPIQVPADPFVSPDDTLTPEDQLIQDFTTVTEDCA